MNAKTGAQERIRQAAVELMAKRGVAGTTTQDIAHRARCSQAAIYKYWDSKEVLAKELFDQAQARMIAAMEDGASQAPGEERVVGVLEGLMRFARENPSEYAYLFQVFHSDYARWLTGHVKPRDVLLREIRSSRSGPEEAADLKTALLLGMAVRLAFFERQGLVSPEAGPPESGLRKAAMAVLATPC